jgi:hypothetical protein
MYYFRSISEQKKEGVGPELRGGIQCTYVTGISNGAHSEAGVTLAAQYDNITITKVSRRMGHILLILLLEL